MKTYNIYDMTYKLSMKLLTMYKVANKITE